MKGPEERTSSGELSAGERLFRLPWRFLKGVVAVDGLPPVAGPEIAFAGRSNVGKSSLINALAGTRGLARTSNTPGRTQEVNFFEAPGTRLRIVDLPGYGFAQAPRAAIEQWTALIRDYLRGRPNLARALVLIDARHGIKTVDGEILDMLDVAAVPYQIVLTKADKIGLAARDHIIAETVAMIAKRPAAMAAVLATSSETGEGIPALRDLIATVATDHGG
jgi:GTP-binding protein